MVTAQKPPACIVLWWGTTLESLLLFFFCKNAFSMLCQNRVLNTSLISVKTCMRIQYLYKNAFYALQKSRFEYESDFSEDVYA